MSTGTVDKIREDFKTLGEILIQRGAVYGDPKDNFEIISQIYEAVRGDPISPKEVAFVMLAVKLSRLRHTPDHIDSVHDAVNYLMISAEL
jgi:hypothetical protein